MQHGVLACKTNCCELVQEAAAVVAGKWDQLDILINNAGERSESNQIRPQSHEKVRQKVICVCHPAGITGGMRMGREE